MKIKIPSYKKRLDNDSTQSKTSNTILAVPQRRKFLRYSGLAGALGASWLLAGRNAKAQEVVLPDCVAAPEPKPKKKKKEPKRLRVHSRQAMEELNAMIAKINLEYFSPKLFFNTVSDIAEGQRYLMNLISAATEFYLEGDPLRPWFANMVTPTRKYLGDNPDAIYFFTRINGNHYYRIRGRRMGNEYISYTVYTGSSDGNWNAPGIAHINHRDMAFEANGEYEILVGPKRDGAKNWLKTHAKAFHIISRHYYEHTLSAASDYKIRPELTIEHIKPTIKPVQYQRDKEIAQGIRSVANFLKVATLDLPRPGPGSVPIFWSTTANRIGIPVRFGDDQNDVGFGAIDNTYAAGPYNLKPKEALVMRGVLPACFFANVVLSNRFQQTDNYVHSTISLNRQQMTLDKDGRYTVVVSAIDPKTPNWLNTNGRSNGIIFWRFLLAEGETERPQTEVMHVKKVKALFK